MTDDAHAIYFFFFSSRRRHTRFDCDWSSDVCSSDLPISTILPPCFASTRIALAGAPPIADTVNLPSGHQLSISFRNTLNALSWLQGTSIVLMIGSSITFSFWVSCVAQSQHHKKTRLPTRTSPDTSVDHRARRA